MNDQEYLLNLLRNNLLNSEENTDLYDYVKSKWEKLKSDNIRAREIAERQYSEPNTAFISDDETFEHWMYCMIDGYECEFELAQHLDQDCSDIEVSNILLRFESSIDVEQQALNHEIHELEELQRTGMFDNLPAELEELDRLFGSRQSDQISSAEGFDDDDLNDPDGPSGSGGSAPGGNFNDQNPSPDSGNGSFDRPMNEEPESPPPSDFSEFDPVSGNEDSLLKKKLSNVKKLDSLFSNLQISQVAA